MNCKGSVVGCLSMIVMALILSGCGYHYTCNVTFGGPPCGSGNGGGTFTSGGNNGNGSLGSDLMYTVASGGGFSTGGFFVEGGALANGAINPYKVALPIVPFGAYQDLAIVNKQFLYLPYTAQTSASSSGPGLILGFGISHVDGSLNPLSGSPFATSQNASVSVAFDNQGKFLFVGDTGTGTSGGTIASFAISSTGVLTAASGSPLAVAGSPQVMVVDPSGKYLYASFATAGGIMAFTIDPTTGALTEMTGSPFNVNPTANMTDLKAESSGKFLVGTTNSRTTIPSDQHVYVMPISSTTGALSTATPFPTSAFPVAVATNPVAGFIYAFTQTAQLANAPIEGFSIDSSGTLTPISGSPFSAIDGGFFGKFDQNGTQLFYPESQTEFSVAAPDATTGALTPTVVRSQIRHGNGLDEIDEFAVTN